MGLIAWFKQLMARHRAWKKSMKPREYSATVVADEIHITRPDGSQEAVDLAYLRKVLVITNDSGPWGQDVWLVLEGSKYRVEFSLETEGINEVMALLGKLPGFEVRGMNSVENAEFECWPNPSP